MLRPALAIWLLGVSSCASGPGWRVAPAHVDGPEIRPQAPLSPPDVSTRSSLLTQLRRARTAAREASVTDLDQLAWEADERATGHILEAERAEVELLAVERSLEALEERAKAFERSKTSQPFTGWISWLGYPFNCMPKPELYVCGVQRTLTLTWKQLGALKLDRGFYIEGWGHHAGAHFVIDSLSVAENNPAHMCPDELDESSYQVRRQDLRAAAKVARELASQALEAALYYRMESQERKPPRH
ncbi:MAG: hypothetical protein R3B07_15140 [Polyangiaceae bacterium]